MSAHTLNPTKFRQHNVSLGGVSITPGCSWSILVMRQQEYLIWGTWRKLLAQEHPYQDRSGRSLISNLCLYYQAPVAEFSDLTRGRERGDSGRPYLNLHPLPSEPKVTQTSRCSDTTLSRPRIPRTRNPEGWFGITTHNTHNLSDRNKRWYI